MQTEVDSQERGKEALVKVQAQQQADAKVAAVETAEELHKLLHSADDAAGAPIDVMAQGEEISSRTGGHEGVGIEAEREANV
jgi:hypothetical protein